MSFENNFIPKAPIESKRQVAQQQSFSRSDVATTKRAIQDLENETKKLRDAIMQMASTDSDCPQELFEAAWQKQKQLNLANKELASLKQRLNNCLPHTSTARITDKERKEIRGLYSTGLYTQGQLAEQYGVTQPTISDITKEREPK